MFILESDVGYYRKNNKLNGPMYLSRFTTLNFIDLSYLVAYYVCVHKQHLLSLHINQLECLCAPKHSFELSANQIDVDPVNSIKSNFPVQINRVIASNIDVHVQQAQSNYIKINTGHKKVNVMR